jgi:hypothetical protein
MEHRLGRTLRVFLGVLAAAGFYRLAVVPWVEPRSRDVAAGLDLSPEQAAAIRARADRRLAALGDVFPPGCWERDDPIMLESRQMRLLFKDYHSLPDGRVNLVPCTLVVLPDRNRAATAASSGRTVVLRAPQGAVLEFDEPIDLRQGRLAKLVGGSLRGQVTIRGTPSDPGAEDDVEIVTRDITLEDLEVRTGEAVQFRYGRSSGSGRGLVVRLTPRADPQAQGPNIGGVDSIRLERDVRMRLEGLRGGLLPGNASAEAPSGSAPPPPVLVSCRGSMNLNLSANMVTLEDHVDVIRAGADAATDHLVCDLLAILLARRGGEPEGGGEPRGPLEPAEIQAKGTPVVVTSAEAGLEARAARLGYEIATRRILLDGGESVSLVVKGSEMEARKIDYAPGPAGTPGALMAVGPGWLDARAEGSPPVRARWQQWLRMRPDGAGHVVSLSGDAEVNVTGQGRLGAGEMHLWLEMLAAAPAAATMDTDLARLRPSRLLARGMVEADAEQVVARTDRLELWFRSEEPQPSSEPSVPEGSPTVVAAPESPAVPTVPTSAPAVAAVEPAAPTRGRIIATASLVRGMVTLAASGNQVEELSMEGQVRLLEQQLAELPAPAAAREPSLEILGDQLQLSRATRFDARAIVCGRPARVRGQGLDLEGPLVEFDRGRGRLLVDGAGRLTLPPSAAGDGLGSLRFASPSDPVVAQPADQPMEVTWQGRLDFDGLTARFTEQVMATSAEATVRAGVIDVIFDRPFDFASETAGRPGLPGAGQPQLARVACGSGVQVESRSTTDDGGNSREQLFARDLVFDRLTGDVSGTGPGRLTSTRFGDAPSFQSSGPTAGGPGLTQPVAAARSAPGLTYLGVDFQRGLRGNLGRRMMEFHQRVEAIWGPVADWDDTLDAHAPGGPPAGSVTVSCDALGIAQMPEIPGQARASLELAAGGNVLVEGESFTARSARLTWSEGKDLLVFEGDGRSDAQLFRQVQVGGRPSSASAGKILFWRALNRVEVEDARFLDLDQLRGAGGPAAGGLPAPSPGTRVLPGT